MYVFARDRTCRFVSLCLCLHVSFSPPPPPTAPPLSLSLSVGEKGRGGLEGGGGLLLKMFTEVRQSSDFVLFCFVSGLFVCFSSFQRRQMFWSGRFKAKFRSVQGGGGQTNEQKPPNFLSICCCLSRITAICHVCSCEDECRVPLQSRRVWVRRGSSHRAIKFDTWQFSRLRGEAEISQNTCAKGRRQHAVSRICQKRDIY